MRVREFEHITYQGENKFARGVKIHCSQCLAVQTLRVNSFYSGPDGDMKEERFIRRKFERLGWRVGDTSKHDLCPNCVSKNSRYAAANSAFKPVNGEIKAEMKAPESKILVSQNPVPVVKDVEGEALLQVARFGSRSWDLQIFIPISFYTTLGSPLYVQITSTADRGLRLTANPKGNKVNLYSTTHIRISIGVGRVLLSHDIRTRVSVKATLKDNEIKIAIPPEEWLAASYPYKGSKPEAKTKPIVEERKPEPQLPTIQVEKPMINQQKHRSHSDKRREVITLDEGEVIILFPEIISAQSYDDLKTHIEFFLNRLQRRVR